MLILFDILIFGGIYVSQKSSDTITGNNTRKIAVEKEITLKSLAKHLGYTPNYLGTLFKKETGKKYTEFLRDERLNLACVLLESTQMPVYEIAKQTGFENSAYFCRIFKNKFGRSPGQSR